MSAKVYAQALVRAQKQQALPGKVLGEHLIRHLASRGRLKLLPKILQKLRAEHMKEELRAPLVEVASEKEKQEAQTRAKEVGIDAKHIVVNHSLIRGWRAKGNGALIDASAKRSLLHIYKNSTS